MTQRNQKKEEKLVVIDQLDSARAGVPKSIGGVRPSRFEDIGVTRGPSAVTAIFACVPAPGASGARTFVNVQALAYALEKP